jgi:hypothetical protein
MENIKCICGNNSFETIGENTLKCNRCYNEITLRNFTKKAFKKSLETTEIFKHIKKMFEIYFEKNQMVFQKYIIHDESLYSLFITIGSPVHNSNHRTIDRSINKYASYQLDKYIEKSMLGTSTDFLKTIFEFNSQQYELTIEIKPIIKNDFFIFRPSDSEKNARYALQRTYKIIKDSGSYGISKSVFYNKTRRFLGQSERENILMQLIFEDKIRVQLTGNARKRQQIYFAKENIQ